MDIIVILVALIVKLVMAHLLLADLAMMDIIYLQILATNVQINVIPAIVLLIAIHVKRDII